MSLSKDLSAFFTTSVLYQYVMMMGLTVLLF